MSHRVPPFKTALKTLIPFEFQITDIRNEIFDIDITLGGAGVVVLHHHTPQCCLPCSQWLFASKSVSLWGSDVQVDVCFCPPPVDGLHRRSAFPAPCRKARRRVVRSRAMSRLIYASSANYRVHPRSQLRGWIFAQSCHRFPHSAWW